MKRNHNIIEWVVPRDLLIAPAHIVMNGHEES